MTAKVCHKSIAIMHSKCTELSTSKVLVLLLGC